MSSPAPTSRARAARGVIPQPRHSCADTDDEKITQETPFDAMRVASLNDGGISPVRLPTKNVSRERMKSETTFLRARVQELERELSQTLAKKALERCSTAAPAPVWRDLAKRQAARRAKSEQERDRLRMRLLHQLQVAKSLETIFRNRSGAFLDDFCAVDDGAHDHAAYPVDNLALLHEKLMDEIDQVYPDIDIVFNDRVARRDVMESSLRRSTVATQQGNGEEKLYVELRNALFVPFSFERVCDALWRAIRENLSSEERLIEEYRCTDDEYTCAFLVLNHAPGHDHNFVSSIVMRKFANDKQTVFVWRSVNWDRATGGDPREYGDETGWLTVERTVDAISGERSRDGTIVRVCARYMPIWETPMSLPEATEVHIQQQPPSDEDADAPHLLKVGDVTNRLLNGTEEDIAAITESIENILLDESIGAADEDLAAVLGEFDVVCDQPKAPNSVDATRSGQPSIAIPGAVHSIPSRYSHVAD